MNRSKHIVIYVDVFLLMIILILGIFYSLNIPLFQEEKAVENTALIIHRNSIKRAYNSTRKPKKRPI